MMNRLLRLISVILLSASIGFVIFYLLNQSGDSLSSAYDHPSYYYSRDLIFIFVSGTVGVICAIVSNFLTWMKKMDIKEDVLTNAGFVDGKVRDAMISGSTLDMTTENATVTSVAEDATELVSEDATELVSEDATELVGEKATELIKEEDKTEMIDGGDNDER